MPALPSLPPELWLYIYQLATADLVPRGGATPAQALSDLEMKRYLQAARSLGRVCRTWNRLAHEVLYENVWVNDGFASLAAAVARPEIGRLVRRIRLSTTRFDRNVSILTKCPQVEMLVLPEFPRSGRLYTVQDIQIPPLLELRELYWVHSYWSSELLLKVLQLAPNLTHVCLLTSSTIGADADESPRVPTLQHVETLSITCLDSRFVRALLRSDLRSLVDLTIDPGHFNWSNFPILPGLRKLTLSAHPMPTVVLFPAIFTRCPNVRDLRYDVRSRVQPPEVEGAGAVAAGLVCIRLSLPVSTVNVWNVEDQCQLLVQPAFAGIERVVLEGRWSDSDVKVKVGPSLQNLRNALLARGGELVYGVD
ncbi:hypothetical protein FB45DRAFT_1024856 [Roridomyces roridus]|uniref:F-box domain-containing protein n=1 Tax=Roridomyces roridus TaxID=1738132 RepID=A0AAD7C1P9_9AGAR|nr:hypothetical protein FB45DRAFT_1024856 [Roridomyces roridus]